MAASPGARLMGRKIPPGQSCVNIIATIGLTAAARCAMVRLPGDVVASGTRHSHKAKTRAISSLSGQHIGQERALWGAHPCRRERVATPADVLPWDASAAVTAPYLQILVDFLRQPELKPGPKAVALALLAHVDPFRPTEPVSLSLSQIGAAAGVSKSQLCLHLRELEARCARCFRYAETRCGCKKKQRMIVRISTKGHSSAKYKILFAANALQKIELSCHRTVTVLPPDSDCPTIGQSLSGNRTLLKIDRSEDLRRSPIPPLRGESIRIPTPKKQKKPSEKSQPHKGSDKEGVFVDQAPPPAAVPGGAADGWRRVVALYHECLPLLPRFEAFGGAIQAEIIDAWKSHPDDDFWRTYFERVGRSDYLTGKVVDFTAKLAWLVKPGNMEKVFAGNFDKVTGVVRKTGDWRDTQPRQNTSVPDATDPAALAGIWSMNFTERTGHPRHSPEEVAYVRGMTAQWRARGCDYDDYEFELEAQFACAPEPIDYTTRRTP